MKDYKYVYLVGIGGIGMSALARWFNAQAVQVFGYDKTATPLTDRLAQEGIQIHFDDRIGAIPAAIRDHKEQTLVIYTPAIPNHNQVLGHFRANRYAVFKRAEVLAMLTRHHRTIAVAGTHGKTTTTALLAHLIYSAGKKMVGFLGGIAKGYGSNLIMNGTSQEDTIMVLEADEFDRSFLHTRPQMAIVTTADPDHLDIYTTQQSFENAFRDFIALIPSTGKAIVHRQVAQQLQLAEDTSHLVRYAVADAPVSASNIDIKNGDFCFD
ncbi:MAG: Mur ligase family protein, partial [Bacteroidota bacterium]